MKYPFGLGSMIASSSNSLVKDVRGTDRVVADNSWILPRLPMEIKRNDVHVWRLQLDQPPSRLSKFASILSAEEQIRAASFRFERHRNRFIVGRGALRTILSFYLNTKPDQLEFCYGTYGKPHLAKRFCSEELQFNLAHSHRLALYAFACGRRVGVDLEYIRNIPDVEKVVDRCLPKQQNAILRMPTSSQKLGAFFDCWTRDEAHGKAIGTGLARSFGQFDDSLVSGGKACVLDIEENSGEASRWSVVSFAPAPHYTATLVVEGHGWRLHCVRFPPENSLGPVQGNTS